MRVARGWGGRFVWGFGRDVGEERLARPNAVAYEGLSFPAEDVGNIVTVTLGEVLFSAVVIHVKVEHPTSRFCGEPVVPAQGYRRQIVSVEVFAEEPGPVTGIVQARGYVVSLVAVVLVALPTTIGTITVTPNPRIMGVLATHDGGPGGQHREVDTNAFSNAMPCDPMRLSVLGIYFRSSLRISSVRIKTKLGGPAVVWAFVGGPL